MTDLAAVLWLALALAVIAIVQTARVIRRGDALKRSKERTTATSEALHRAEKEAALYCNIAQHALKGWNRAIDRVNESTIEMKQVRHEAYQEGLKDGEENYEARMRAEHGVYG